MNPQSLGNQSPVTVVSLQDMKRSGEKIACLTAYDASFARLLDDAGVDVLLVGDSLGMVVQGQETTIPVTVDDMVYHSRAVARGRRQALLMVDMPFMSYGRPEQALDNAARHGPTVINHVIHGNRNSGFLTLEDHAERISDQEDIDAGIIQQPSKARIIGGQTGDLLARPFHVLQRHHCDG